MDTNELDFSFDMQGTDRNALLAEAAERLDALRGHLGPDGKAEPSNEGDQARLAMEEEVEVGAIPKVYKITQNDYLARQLKAPLQVEQLLKKYNFYWIQIPIFLHTRENWFFNKLELRIEFNLDEPRPELRPTAYQILPHRKFQKLIEAEQHLTVGVNENFELEVKTGAIDLQTPDGQRKAHMQAGVDGVADGGFKLVIGPFEYTIKRAKIEHTDTNNVAVFWRIVGAEFFQEDRPEFIVVAQVPKKTKTVTIAPRLQAYRSLNGWSATFQLLSKNLPMSLREYFKGGAPIVHDPGPWDITSLL